MTEKNLVVNNKELTYQGIFRVDELFAALNKALEDKKYTKQEKKSEELVTPLGRMLQLELRPYKVMTEYITLMIKIQATLDNVTDVVLKRNGVKEKFQQGDVHLAFDAWSLTDYERRWGTKPLVYFLKGVIHKYLYKFPLEEGLVKEVAADTAYVYAQVKKLLHSYEGKEVAVPKEEDVRRKVEEEMVQEAEEEQ